jgi:hypothetical protein
VIFVGIDDTDTLDTPGTNQLARALVKHVCGQCRCVLIVRHQLLEDPRVPCTSHNGSASILLEAEARCSVPALIDALGRRMREGFVPLSDPGLCVAAAVPPAVTEFGRRCQRELVTQQEARDLAAEHRLHLEGLGGTKEGVIGALAAVGLAAGGDDGRVVHIGGWPDDLAGPQEIATLRARRVEIRDFATRQPVGRGRVDVGKHLRPNYRNNQVVLFVESAAPGPVPWRAVRLK